ncbi:MAG: hypothetical protein LBH91_04440 [Prevotellaceae bacterium]|jgi:hypothetical protein|nr:hypothetical protein [Prevotellaceae bacterium]
MDNYKYIEELLDKYWTCETNLEEETILREFFSQEQELPAHLQQYRHLFIYLQEEQEIKLSADFEAQLLEKITAQPRTPHFVSRTSYRTSFFFKIAAGLLLLLSIGFFAQQHQKIQEQTAARETVITAIGMIAENLQQGETMIDEGLKQLETLYINNKN